jgi:hypothetical protein
MGGLWGSRGCILRFDIEWLVSGFVDERVETFIGVVNVSLYYGILGRIGSVASSL